MRVRYLVRAVAVGLSASLYVASPPQSPRQPERGPMRPRAVVRPPRLEARPAPTTP